MTLSTSINAPGPLGGWIIGGAPVWGGGSGYSAEAIAYFAGMSVQPDATRKGQLDTLITSLKSAGVWAKLDALYIMAAHDAQAARVNAVAPGSVATITNLITLGSQLDNAVWTKSNTTVTADAAVAPDGTTTAEKLAETATTGVHNAGQSITTAAVAHTFSVYVKAAERNFALIYHTQTNASLSVNLTTGATGTASGTVAPTSSSVTSAGNGWWRVTMTVTATAAANFFGVYVMNDLVNASYAGTAGNGIYVWGGELAQVQFTADRGYVSNGTTGYIDTGWNPTTAPSPQYAQNSAHAGVWVGTHASGANDFGLNNYNMIAADAFGNYRAYANTANFASATNGGSAIGHTMVTRRLASGAGAYEGYRNGVGGATGTAASTALVNANFYVCAVNSSTTGGSTPASFTTRRQQAVHWGSQLSSSEVTDLYNALAAYMTAVGA